MANHVMNRMIIRRGEPTANSPRPYSDDLKDWSRKRKGKSNTRHRIFWLSPIEHGAGGGVWIGECLARALSKRIGVGSAESRTEALGWGRSGSSEPGGARRGHNKNSTIGLRVSQSCHKSVWAPRDDDCDNDGDYDDDDD